MMLKTYRECLRDVFDLPSLMMLLRQLERRKVRVATITTEKPSPFATSLLFRYVANYIYDGDAPLAERRAQALSIDQAQLRDLLGQIELRDLLDAEAIEAVERQLQHLDEKYHVRHTDGLHDLLIRIGDLSKAEIAARTVDAGVVDFRLLSAVLSGPLLSSAFGLQWQHFRSEDGTCRIRAGLRPRKSESCRSSDGSRQSP